MLNSPGSSLQDMQWAESNLKQLDDMPLQKMMPLKEAIDLRNHKAEENRNRMPKEWLRTRATLTRDRRVWDAKSVPLPETPPN